MENEKITEDVILTEDPIASALQKKLLDLSIKHEELRESLNSDIAKATRDARTKAEAEQIRSLSEKLS